MAVVTEHIATRLLGHSVLGKIELCDPNNTSERAEIEDIDLIEPNDKFIFIPAKPARMLPDAVLSSTPLVTRQHKRRPVTQEQTTKRAKPVHAEGLSHEERRSTYSEHLQKDNNNTKSSRMQPDANLEQQDEVDSSDDEHYKSIMQSHIIGDSDASNATAARQERERPKRPVTQEQTSKRAKTVHAEGLSHEERRSTYSEHLQKDNNNTKSSRMQPDANLEQQDEVDSSDDEHYKSIMQSHIIGDSDASNASAARQETERSKNLSSTPSNEDELETNVMAAISSDSQTELAHSELATSDEPIEELDELVSNTLRSVRKEKNISSPLFASPTEAIKRVSSITLPEEIKNPNSKRSDVAFPADYQPPPKNFHAQSRQRNEPHSKNAHIHETSNRGLAKIAPNNQPPTKHTHTHEISHNTLAPKPQGQKLTSHFPIRQNQHHGESWTHTPALQQDYNRLPEHSCTLPEYTTRGVRKRTSVDGSVKPVKRPAVDKNGNFLRPAGRGRKGMVWDGIKGVWVPKRVSKNKRFGME
eukprot:CAMPEP_0194261202 /NCGR_PEP_ID=MMETSP0158-20130606/45904_1 /TAXON_ID=33649 /ORGANISM="Thalassionema nitzschioides, Strain L26-B" /LENGTH=528 /DNA_ID=CAMNT_0039001317 /DNA_START=112 /DNA_END=1698 /DNA_ORIENTATION=+